jgi:hypothetical protein
MADKFVNQIRRHQGEGREPRRVEDGGVGAEDVASPDPGPGRFASARELLEEARRRLTPGNRRLPELRLQGRERADIASEVGGTAEGLRKQFTRAAGRVARSLGLEEASHE